MGVNQDQKDYWSSPAGLKWIEHEKALDAAMAGMLDLVLDAARIAPGGRVIDVGCGTGASTLGAARRASRGHAVGVDIAKPLLDRAALRAREEDVANASFLLADAQTYRFDKAPFDVLVSRIGMSFFSDSLAAFRNLGEAMMNGGRMSFVCWASAAQNPWFYIPQRAAEARLGALSAGDPCAPGPTAFQDIHYVTGLMSQAGLSEIEGKVIELTLTPPDGSRGAARAASRVGPAARIIKAFGADETDATVIEDEVAKAFEQYERKGQAGVPATVNLFTCRT